MDVSYIYWEGAVEVSGTNAGNPVSGVGFVEMTGYAVSLEGEF
jgi:predicted secreted hydrolase